MNKINLIREGEHMQIELHSDKQPDIDKILDELNSTHANIVTEEHDFKKPFRVDFTDGDDIVIATIIMEEF